MDKEELRYEDVLEIVRLFDGSRDLSELHLRLGDTELTLRKQAAEGPALAKHSATGILQTPPAAPSASVTKHAAPRAVETIPAQEPLIAASNAVSVKSPTVGTFYCAPEPSATPFVTVGQHVTPDTTVCIIEVMKVMNAIPANCSGTVSQILVKDNDSVEFGQTLIFIEPD